MGVGSLMERRPGLGIALTRADCIFFLSTQLHPLCFRWNYPSPTILEGLDCEMVTKVKTQSLNFTMYSIYVWRVIVSVVVMPNMTASLGNSTYSCRHHREPWLLWTRLKMVIAAVPASYCGLGHAGAKGLSGSMMSRASQGGWEAARAYSAARTGCGMMLGEPSR